MTAVIASKDWTVFHHHMPGIPVTLRLQGLVIFPTPGYKVTITAAPPGINPRILELDWHETAPKGPVPDVVTDIPVRYELATTAEFDQVHVRDVGHVIDVYCVY